MGTPTDLLNICPACRALPGPNDGDQTLVIPPEHLPLPSIHQIARHQGVTRSATGETKYMATSQVTWEVDGSSRFSNWLQDWHQLLLPW